jgi:SSS family solute:Na+ symporter
MSTIDWAVLFVYLIGIVVLGYWVGRNNRKIDDFFLAGREMPWWAVGLSVMATQISAITFVSTTAQAYTDGMRFLVVYFALPFAMVILCLTLVPFFYRAQVFTAYEYLENRFDLKTRTLTSLCFLIQRGMAVGVTLYAPSIVLAAILGLSEATTIFLMAGGTILYVLKGGNRSVIWTDVVQMAIIWFGIFLCLLIAIWNLPTTFSLRDALGLAQANGRLNAISFDTSLETPYTLWSGVIGGLFLMLSYFGCDQSQVQRYLSGSSLRESRLSLLFNAFLKVPMQFLILLTGALVFVFYHFEKPPALFNPVAETRLRQLAPQELLPAEERYSAAFEARKASALAFAEARRLGGQGDAETLVKTQADFTAARNDVVGVYKKATGDTGYGDNNYIFLTYILNELPVGAVGLVIAVIFAAAMSTLSGEFNSLATATMIDFVRRFRAPGSGTDAGDLMLSRAFTAFWGGFAIFIALQAGRLGSAIEVVNRFGSYFYGSILGVFMLAVLTKRANGTGATVGLVAGMGVVAFVATTTKVHFLWWNLIGAVAVFVVGYAISLATSVTRKAE